jgi:phosphatidylglycerophosphate synthase
MAESSSKMTAVFPIIRHLSKPLSNLLVKLPITPNQITGAALIYGLIGCLFLISPKQEMRVIGSLLFIFGYILDNCDGEVARIKNLTSEFGEKYDTFVDWIVHAVFFITLGYGIAQETNDYLWLWLGFAGGVGGTINYLIGMFKEKSDDTIEVESQPENVKEYLVYIFRELFRADFCFIVLILALVDEIWLLLPAGAVGAQVYWLMHIMSRDKNYHV